MRLVATLLAILAILPPLAVAQEDTTTGTLDLTVMVVSDDLQLAPVPKFQFTIQSTHGDVSSAVGITTSFSGKATIDLPPGEYTILSNGPLKFQNRHFTWRTTFVVTGGVTTALELSNDNALVEIASSEASEVQLDEGDLYQAVRQRVFKILSDSGHGSGFLVDVEHGLVVTNHHVVANSDYLAVKVDVDLQYPARLVVVDDINDIAVLQVNPSVVRELSAVQLADDTPARPSCEVGDRVVAIGSPLATETILTSGLVSKVEQGAIYSDVNINPGNSGGPLFNARREVIGVNTFGLVASGSPGIAGIVRIHLVRDLLAKAYDSDLTSPPDPVTLPVESSFRFPAEVIREAALTKTFDVRQYHVEAGKFDVQLITPVLVAGLEVAEEKAAAAGRDKRNKKRSSGATASYKPGQDFYEWRKYAGDYRAVVTVQAVPEIAMTGGSAFAVIMLGPNAPQKFVFKTDFDRMELWRGETLVRPIHPMRSANVVNFQQGTASMSDVGFYGMYLYPPEAFRPGATLTLKVWKQGDPEPIVKAVGPSQHAQVWQDFEPYFDAMDKAVAESQSEPAE